MKIIDGLKISDTAFNTIKNRVSICKTEPYMFYVNGVNAVGGKLNSAYSAFRKIEKWALKNGSEVTLIDEVGCSLKVEITDPVAKSIEKILRN